jgi:hypothetical protein
VKSSSNEEIVEDNRKNGSGDEPYVFGFGVVVVMNLERGE